MFLHAGCYCMSLLGGGGVVKIREGKCLVFQLWSIRSSRETIHLFLIRGAKAEVFCPLRFCILSCNLALRSMYKV